MDFGIDHRGSDQEREHRHKEEEYFLPGRLLQFVLQVPEKGTGFCQEKPYSEKFAPPGQRILVHQDDIRLQLQARNAMRWSFHVPE